MARSFVRELLELWRLPERGDLEWCVGELVTNAMFVGCERATITVWWNEPMLRVEVAGAAPVGAPRGDRLGGPRWTGEGFAIVDAVADAWGVREDPAAGTVVWFGLIVEP